MKPRDEDYVHHILGAISSIDLQGLCGTDRIKRGGRLLRRTLRLDPGCRGFSRHNSEGTARRISGSGG